MIEHRLIEKMLKAMDREAAKIRRDKGRSRADRYGRGFYQGLCRSYHHGKEEDILFKELAKNDDAGRRRHDA